MSLATYFTKRMPIPCAAAFMVLVFSGSVGAQEVLPFPDPPMGGKVGPTMQESVHKWREAPRHLYEDAPNILIVMFDDAGFGQPDTFGGEIHTPTLTRLAESGISYNRFHTTAMCSPTRAALGYPSSYRYRLLLSAEISLDTCQRI